MKPHTFLTWQANCYEDCSFNAEYRAIICHDHNLEYVVIEEKYINPFDEVVWVPLQDEYSPACLQALLVKLYHDMTPVKQEKKKGKKNKKGQK